MSDLLLEWMSYRGEGTVDDVPAGLVRSPRHTQGNLESLAMLGHIDLDRSQNEWKICIPVLAGLTDGTESPVSAILCGARTPVLLERLAVSSKAEGAEMQSEEVARLPSRITVRAEDNYTLRRVAQASGLRFQEDAALSILACLPTVKAWPRQNCPMPVGLVGEVRRFSRSQCNWAASNLDEAKSAEKGLFRIQKDWKSVTLLKQGADAQVEIDIYAGRLWVAAGLKKLGWNSNSATLRIPFLLRPPLIICRGLALCDGRPPVTDFGSRESIFTNVPLRIARLASDLTGLRFA